MQIFTETTNTNTGRIDSMSAPSQPTDSSRMATNSTNSVSPGGVLSDELHKATGTKPKVFDENGAVGGAFTRMFAHFLPFPPPHGIVLT